MKSLTKAQRRTLTERQAKIDAATNAIEVLEALEIYCGVLLDDKYFEAGYKKAIELAKDVSEAWQVFDHVDITDTPEQLIAFDKLLSLTKDKDDVEEILVKICDLWSMSLDLEKFLIPLFKRAHELPCREEDTPE